MHILDKFPDKALEMALEARRSGFLTSSFAVIEMPCIWLLKACGLICGERRGTYSIVAYKCEFDSLRMAQDWLSILGNVPDDDIIAELKARAKAREYAETWIDILTDKLSENGERIEILRQQRAKVIPKKPRREIANHNEITCLECGVRTYVRIGETLCKRCRYNNRRRDARKYRKEHGLCYNCGKRAEVGRVYCTECRLKYKTKWERSE